MARANGTYHPVTLPRHDPRRTRLLIGVGGFVAVLGLFNVVLVTGAMHALETSGPERLALAGSGIERFVPSLLANLQRATAPPTTINAPSPIDPRRSPEYIAHKQGLERWMGVLGIGLAALFIGLERTIPDRRSSTRSPLGTDLARVLVLLSLAYVAFSFFEG